MLINMVISLFLLNLMLPTAVMARKATSEKCKTQYPIIFAHGFSAKEGMLGFFDYFWGVEELIHKEGGLTLTPTVNSMDSTEVKAKSFKAQVEDYLLLTGAEKVNIIGHSHGGVYSRYAITMLGMGHLVASLTTIDSVHRGSSGPDMVLEMCGAINKIMGVKDGVTENIAAGIVDIIYENILGDDSPQSKLNCTNMSTDYMKNIFNPVVKDIPGIHYQSYAGVIKYISPLNSWAILLWPSIGVREGPNDGCVSEYSARWGHYKGKVKGSWWCSGVDHIKIIGQPFGITPGFNAPLFYRNIVRELKRDGY